MSPEELGEIEHESLTRVPEVSDYTEDRLDTWKMFQLSYRDSLLNLIKEKMREKSFVAGKFVPVCYIPPNFKLEEVDTDFSVDGTHTPTPTQMVVQFVFVSLSSSYNDQDFRFPDILRTTATEM